MIISIDESSYMEAHDQVSQTILSGGDGGGRSAMTAAEAGKDDGGGRSAMTAAAAGKDDDVQRLPGFRFHPTDEELVGFYLRRKIEKRPLSIEIIRQVDIYKFDPWDLPKETSDNSVDKEWYFFCKRGRKYRNSIRPNRVTGSGFWKATGIDKPIYSAEGGGDCIGLKKSLVYYRGAAGKGTKTDWMMHEFRMPPSADKRAENMDAKSIAREAEVWTVCRILKRSPSHRKIIIPDWRQVAAQRCKNTLVDANSKTCSVESPGKNSYIRFTDQAAASALLYRQQEVMEQKPYPYTFDHGHGVPNHHFQGHFSPSQLQSIACSASLPGASGGSDMTELLRHAGWEDLQSVVDGAAAVAAAGGFLMQE